MKIRQSPFKLDIDNCRRLFAAVVARAVSDYQRLWSAGIVRGEKRIVSVTWHTDALGAGCKTNRDVDALCRFLSPDILDDWATRVHLQYSGDYIRRYLDRPPSTND